MESQFDVVAPGELLIDFAEYGASAQGNGLFEACPGGAAQCAGQVLGAGAFKLTQVFTYMFMKAANKILNQKQERLAAVVGRRRSFSACARHGQ